MSEHNEHVAVFGKAEPAKYANACNVRFTAEEAFLQFAQTGMGEPDMALEVATVCVSLSHAKRIAEAILRTLKTHEETFGEVIADPVDRLTPEGRQRLEAAGAIVTRK